MDLKVCLPCCFESLARELADDDRIIRLQELEGIRVTEFNLNGSPNDADGLVDVYERTLPSLRQPGD